MNKIALTALTCVAAVSSSFAGQPVVADGKDVKTTTRPEPMTSCFADREFQLDLFGSFTNTRHGADGWGGGIAANYFFLRYLGVGVDGNISSANNGLWNGSGSLIARYPLELGHFCIAPYALGGGGVHTDGHTRGTWHAGGGLEWRATPKFGVFTEGRYIWTDEDRDSVRISAGIRFVF